MTSAVNNWGADGPIDLLQTFGNGSWVDNVNWTVPDRGGFKPPVELPNSIAADSSYYGADPLPDYDYYEYYIEGSGGGADPLGDMYVSQGVLWRMQQATKKRDFQDYDPPRSRAEFFAQYDPSIGVGTALTLGVFFLVTTAPVLCKLAAKRWSHWVLTHDWTLRGWLRFVRTGGKSRFQLRPCDLNSPSDDTKGSPERRKMSMKGVGAGRCRVGVHSSSAHESQCIDGRPVLAIDLDADSILTPSPRPDASALPLPSVTLTMDDRLSQHRLQLAHDETERGDGDTTPPGTRPGTLVLYQAPSASESHSFAANKSPYKWLRSHTFHVPFSRRNGPRFATLKGRGSGDDESSSDDASWRRGRAYAKDSGARLLPSEDERPVLAPLATGEAICMQVDEITQTAQPARVHNGQHSRNAHRATSFRTGIGPTVGSMPTGHQCGNQDTGSYRSRLSKSFCDRSTAGTNNNANEKVSGHALVPSPNLSHSSYRQATNASAFSDICEV